MTPYKPVQKECIIVCMYACIYACMYVHLCMYVWMYVCISACDYTYACMYVCMYVCMLPDCSKTTGRRATKLRLPTKHSPGKVLKLYWMARLIRSAGYRNPMQKYRVAMATDRTAKISGQFDTAQTKYLLEVRCHAERTGKTSGQVRNRPRDWKLKLTIHRKTENCWSEPIDRKTYSHKAHQSSERKGGKAFLKVCQSSKRN